MAVPKKKTSYSKKNMRHSTKQIKNIHYTKCLNCGNIKKMYTVCSHCGVYRKTKNGLI